MRVSSQHDMDLDSRPYYAVSSNQMYDKSKKTWSQRLKISKSEKSPNSTPAPHSTPTIHEFHSDYAQSALSRSMKYAEPWIYGTVRGIPARPVQHGGQAIFAPFPTEVAVVVCSCPEYLSGTKRDVKKASVCKKCKGSRLPLAPIGGTVRIRPTQSLHHTNSRSAGTVRIVTSSKSRPSILDPFNDPYDLMRRSRLLSPEPKPSKSPEKQYRNRAKSTSPSRGRSRNRETTVDAKTLLPIAKSDNSRCHSANRNQPDCWLEKVESEQSARRSILQCNVNPYDLISSGSANEFAPNSDDIFTIRAHPGKLDDKNMRKVTPNTISTSKGVKNYSNVTAIAGQRISFGENSTSSSLITQNSDSFVYENVSRTAENGSAGRKGHDKGDTAVEQEQPKRPPRRKQDSLSADEDNEVVVSQKPAELPAALPTSHKQSIKSILKRPSSVPSALPSNGQAQMPLSTTSTAENDAGKYSGHSHSRASSMPADPMLEARQRQMKLLSTSKSKDAMNGSVNGNGGSVATKASIKGDGQKANETKTGSQFYIPLPPLPQARKKVQFMVEDRIIQDEDGHCDDMDNYDSVGGDCQQDVQSETNNARKCSNNSDKDISFDGHAVDVHNNDENERPVQKQAHEQQEAVLRQLQLESRVICVENDEQRNGKYQQDGLLVKDAPGDYEDVLPPLLAETTGNKPLTNQPTAKPTKSPFRKRNSIRRTHSARHSNNTTSATNLILNFNDTMALRVKNPRSDTRDLFVVDRTSQVGSSGCAGQPMSYRPRDPPPPPPSAKTVTTKSTKDSAVSQAVSPDKASLKGLAEKTRQSNPASDKDNPQQTKLRTWTKDNAASDKTTKTAIYDNPDKENSTCSGSVASVIPDFKEPTSGIKLFGSTGNCKTVVRVAPFNKTSSEIHRLKIVHTDNESPVKVGMGGDTVVGHKRTSILINGDDCYSTVNVSNDTPLYQSSVVVTDGSHSPPLPLVANSNTVTINVCSPTRSPADDLIYKNNKINSLLSQSGAADEKTPKRGRTLIKLDFEKCEHKSSPMPEVFSHEEELVKILRNPVEAVRRNLVPHVCGKSSSDEKKVDRNSFIGKLLEDPTLSHLAEGLESEVVAKLIENSLKRLKESRSNIDISGTKDNDDVGKFINTSLQRIKEERIRLEANNNPKVIEEQESQSNRGSISSGNSFSSANYEMFEFENNESDCYQSCSSEITTGDEEANSTRSKFYQMLVDATLAEIEISTNVDDDHHYESIRLNGDPIYEEISEVPPPLPLSPPPLMNELDLDKKGTRSIFEGASKYDILSYLVDAKERGIVREEPFEYNVNSSNPIIIEEECDTVSDLKQKFVPEIHSPNDSSEDTSLSSSINDKLSPASMAHLHLHRKPNSTDIERNDSGVGSETSKSSRSKYQNPPACLLNKNSPIHLCEDCDGPVDTQVTDSGVMFAPLVCRKCGKKRVERKEIITEIVETEEKYGRDLQIILEEFCQPMLVAGLLTQEQLSAIFLNTEELLENNQTLAERMRDALDIALEQGDDDLLTVNIGKVFLESTQMLHAFESYCVRQAGASLLLANLEKEKELLRIFLKVSQMENAVLRRMNLNSFLMVPVQRVTKYPLLLARLYKVTPSHLEGRDLLKQAQVKIELHLNHINQEAKDVPTKLWRRISSSSPNRRASCEIDMINIKLRKMAIDILEWNHDEVRFAMEGKLLLTQPTDSNWKKGRTIKLTPVNALLVTNGKPTANYKGDKVNADQLNFPKHTGIREASLLLVKEKCGRYTLLREPLYLDKCVICTEADWDDYFEVHEISSKDTFIFKAEDGVRTKQWYIQLQYHAQGMGAWRKRRSALANIMINGMLSRT